MKNKTNIFISLLVFITLIIIAINYVLYSKIQDNTNSPVSLPNTIKTNNIKKSPNKNVNQMEIPGKSRRLQNFLVGFNTLTEESCDSSKTCQGNCIVRNKDEPAYCAPDNNIFGCKNTIENVAAGEGILCID